MVEDVQLVITPKLVINVTFVDDVHEDIVSPDVVESNCMDPPLLMFCWDLSPVLMMYPFFHLWI